MCVCFFFFFGGGGGLVFSSVGSWFRAWALDLGSSVIVFAVSHYAIPKLFIQAASSKVSERSGLRP